MAASQLPPDLSSAERARQLVIDELRRTAGLSDETRFRVELLTTELVTNAVRHAGSPPRITVERRGGRIRVQVADDSDEAPTPPSAEAPTRHRGLLLVEDLSEDWGVEIHDGGKVVWFELLES